MSDLAQMEPSTILKAYARWAPVYDSSFGRITETGRNEAVNLINRYQGRVLEAGVGTGISLSDYKSDLSITGIDLSPEMLKIAKQRVEQDRLTNVENILEMDAAELSFDDESFDVVVAMYVMTVVPDPQKVLSELVRVCRTGGQLIIVNHFSNTHGVRKVFEKCLAPLSAKLGWRPEFPIDLIVGHDRLKLIEKRTIKPLGLFTLLNFDKQVAAAQVSTAESNRLAQCDISR